MRPAPNKNIRSLRDNSVRLGATVSGRQRPSSPTRPAVFERALDAHDMIHRPMRIAGALLRFAYPTLHRAHRFKNAVLREKDKANRSPAPRELTELGVVIELADRQGRYNSMTPIVLGYNAADSAGRRRRNPDDDAPLAT